MITSRQKPVHLEVACFSRPHALPGRLMRTLCVSSRCVAKEESKMQMGGAFIGIYASAMRMQNASLSRSGKSLVLASVQGRPGISAVARQVRRLFGLCGGVARRDVSAAADVGATSNEHADSAAWVTRRKAKEEGRKKKVEVGGKKKGKVKVKGGGQNLRGSRRNTGLRNRRFPRDNEFHLLPKGSLEEAPKGDSA